MERTDKTVSIELINMADTTFIVTAGRSFECLEKSIDKIGLVNPPSLYYSQSKACYLVVCGYLRIKALKRLGWKEIPAKIISSQEDEKNIFTFSLFDNLSHRDFNSVERANAVNGLLKYFTLDEIGETCLPLLGMSSRAGGIDDAILFAKLEDEIKESVICGSITEKNAVKLSRMERRDRLCLFELFCGVNLSSSKQAEIIESCRDIALRDDVQIIDFLRNDEVGSILARSKLSLSQKGDCIRKWLRKKRFPRLSRLEEEYSNLKKKLAVPEGIKVEPPPFFEGDKWCVQVEFKTAGALSKAGKRIKALAENPALGEFMEKQQ